MIPNVDLVMATSTIIQCWIGFFEAIKRPMPNIDHSSIDAMLELEAGAPETCFAIARTSRRGAKSAEEDNGQAKEAAADMVQSVQNEANAVDDLVRRTIEERPYTAAVGALAVGWVIGRMGTV